MILVGIWYWTNDFNLETATNVHPAAISLLSMSTTALVSVCPCALCIVIVQLLSFSFVHFVIEA